MIAGPIDRPSASTAVAPWPVFGPEEMEAAARVLASGKVNSWTGEEVREFEREFAEFIGCRHGVAVTNGTVALELSLRILGVGAGDEVITTARSFIASASCAVMVGARPVFADVDPVSQNIRVDAIEQAITKRTKAIVAVHLGGWPCDMDAILELARARGIFVVEDCAQAHGASYKGRRAGSMGDVGAFSFCHDKIITTAGEGGMVTLNSDELYEHAWAYRDHGKKYDPRPTELRPPGFRWSNCSWGSNLRMTEVQAAVGRAQFRKMPDWIEARRRNAQILMGALGGLDAIRVTVPPDWIEHAYYRFYAFVRTEKLREGWTRDRILADLNAKGVPCSAGGRGEMYLEEVFPEAWRPRKPLPVTRELSETSLMFLVHPTLEARQMEFTAQCLRDVLKEAAR